MELHHRVGLTSPVRQAYRENQMKEEDQEEKDEVYDNKACKYLPEANAMCRRSAKVRYLSAGATTTTTATATIARSSQLPSTSSASPQLPSIMETASHRKSDAFGYDTTRLSSLSSSSRFLALTVVMGDWPKSCSLSCCLSIRLSTLC